MDEKIENIESNGTTDEKEEIKPEQAELHDDVNGKYVDESQNVTEKSVKTKKVRKTVQKKKLVRRKSSKGRMPEPKKSEEIEINLDKAVDEVMTNGFFTLKFNPWIKILTILVKILAIKMRDCRSASGRAVLVNITRSDTTTEIHVIFFKIYQKLIGVSFPFGNSSLKCSRIIPRKLFRISSSI